MRALKVAAVQSKWPMLNLKLKWTTGAIKNAQRSKLTENKKCLSISQLKKYKILIYFLTT